MKRDRVRRALRHLERAMCALVEADRDGYTEQLRGELRGLGRCARRLDDVLARVVPRHSRPDQVYLVVRPDEIVRLVDVQRRLAANGISITKQAVHTHLQQLVDEGRLRRVRRGHYYRPLRGAVLMAKGVNAA